MQTPGQVAAQLAVSAQTLRRWSTAFAGVLSPDARPDTGRKRRYCEADVTLLRHAKTLFDAGRMAAEVAAILPTIQLEGESAPSITAAPEVALTVPVSASERFLAVVSDQKTAIERLNAHDDAQAAQLAALTAQVDALTAQLAAIQGVPSAERQRRPAWLRRLMGDDRR